jgi:hypothetical protein
MLNPDVLKQFCGLFKMNVLSHRTPLCARPVVPCCCAKATADCCFAPSGIDVFDINHADDTFKRLLKYAHPNCPDSMKGVWWMQDNVSANQIVTFQDAEWVTKASGIKDSHYNWSSDYGACYGNLSAIFSSGQQRVEILEDGKWVCFLAKDYSDPQWAYVMQEGDVLRRPDGSTAAAAPGDMVRVNYSSPYDPSSWIGYQYRVRCVARLDESGTLVKTAAYDEMLRLAEASNPYRGCCCNYCLCNLSYKEIAEDLEVVNDKQSIIYYPSAWEVQA